MAGPRATLPRHATRGATDGGPRRAPLRPARHRVGRLSARGRAIRWRGGRIAISIPPIRGQVSYFIALHEIGHLVGRGRSAPRLEAEANAWVWALQHSAVEPTAATRRSIVRRPEGYLSRGAKPPVPPLPPRIPERDHVFWRLLAMEEDRAA